MMKLRVIFNEYPNLLYNFTRSTCIYVSDVVFILYVKWTNQLCQSDKDIYNFWGMCGEDMYLSYLCLFVCHENVCVCMCVCL